MKQWLGPWLRDYLLVPLPTVAAQWRLPSRDRQGAVQVKARDRAVRYLARVVRGPRAPAVVVFLGGDAERGRRLALQMRELVPDHPHVIVGPAPLDRAAFAYADEVIETPPGLLAAWRTVRRRLGRRWIALAPFLWPGAGALPFLLAPRKLLAFNAELERHHLRLGCPLASWRFLRGERVGDIFRPTVFAPLRRVARGAVFPFGLLGWALRRPPRPDPLAAGAPAQPGVTAFAAAEFWTEPDRAVATAATERILVGPAHPALEQLLEDPGVWLARRPEAFLFRRDEWLALGGAGRLTARGSGAGGGLVLAALSLLARYRGHQTVFTGGWCPAVELPPEAIPTARLLWRRSPAEVLVFPGRRPGRRRRVAVVSPYLPYPLAHGGAIRIFNLLREAAADTDIYLLAFAEQESEREVEPLLEFCAQVVLVPTPRWEPPSLLPAGVAKFRSPAMEAALAGVVARERIPVVQIEYTQLAHLRCPRPARTILVEHDVTFDLHRQIRRQARGWAKLPAALTEARWRRFELGRARRYDRVIAMSSDDRQRLVQAGMAADRIAVVENGVDLERFQSAGPAGSTELLFIGSFRHFPNILGFRFLVEKIWPTLRAACPELKLTVVAGADHEYYWRRHTGAPTPPQLPGMELLDFVEDVRPLYDRAGIVLAPLVVSAGTNIKVLEALAMERALVATTVGVAGLGLTPGEEVLVGDRADAFAAAVLHLLWNPQAKEDLAAAGRAFVEARCGWNTLGRKLVAVWDEIQAN